MCIRDSVRTTIEIHDLSSADRSRNQECRRPISSRVAVVIAEVRAINLLAIALRVRSEDTTVRPVLDVRPLPIRRVDVVPMSFLAT